MQKRQQQSLTSFFSPKNDSKSHINASPANPSSSKKRYPLVSCSDKEGNIIVSELKPKSDKSVSQQISSSEKIEKADHKDQRNAGTGF